jgi:transcriptional regulator with XRE-family HTH domain
MDCIKDMLPIIRQRLYELHLTEQELGQHLGLSQSGVSRRLSGKKPFTVDELCKVAVFLGLQPELQIIETAPETDYGLHLLHQSLAKLSEQDRREFLFAAALVLEGKLQEPAKSQLCSSLRRLAKIKT